MLFKKSPTRYFKAVLTTILILLSLSLVYYLKPKITPSPSSMELFTDTSHTLPIISIITDEKNLFDPEIGIYVEGNYENILQNGKDWERPAKVSFYEVDGRLAFEENIGLRLHGRGMRSRPQKSFRLYIQDQDGLEKILSYPLFGSSENQNFTSFVLRNGGDNHLSLIRDYLASELVSQDSDLDVLRSRPVVLYLNHQYWGIYFIQERFDSTYFSEKYQIRPKALSIVESIMASGEGKGEVASAYENSDQAAQIYNQILKDVNFCLGCEGYYSINKKVDANNLIDYLLFEMYFANVDWPYNNIKAWRYQPDVFTQAESELIPQWDGRFRWLLFDLDTGFGIGAKTLQDARNGAGSKSYAQLIDTAFPFRNLFYDDLFQSYYLNRLQELSVDVLSGDNVVATIDRLAAQIRPEMPRHLERWQNEDLGNPWIIESPKAWEEQIELLKEFGRFRSTKFLELTIDFITQNSHIK